MPIGRDAHRSAVRFERIVLAVTRSVNTTFRLLDVLPELLGDHRLQVLFTRAGEPSAFDDGTEAQLVSAGVRMVPWEQAKATRFDLIIAASEKEV